MAIILPHVFQDGVNEIASGGQVDEDLNVLKAAIEAIEATAALLTAQLGGLKVRVGKHEPVVGFDNVAGRSRYTAAFAHGLGITPKVAVVTAQPIAITENGGTPSEAVAVSVSALDATNITIVATAPGTTNNGTNFYWVAAG